MPYNSYYNNSYMQTPQYFNPYYTNQLFQNTQQSLKSQENPYNTMILQGKSVESIDVVKAMDIPLDGSKSYFPLIDGSAIVTKQLQQDGTSKTIIYKPVESENKDESPKYVTENELEAQIKDLNGKDIKDIKEELKTLKRKIEDITDDLKDKKEK